MHDIDNLIFRTKRGLLNRTQSYSPGLYHQNPPVASVPHNNAMPPYTIHANVPQTSTDFMVLHQNLQILILQKIHIHLSHLQIKIQLLTIKY